MYNCFIQKVSVHGIGFALNLKHSNLDYVRVFSFDLFTATFNAVFWWGVSFLKIHFAKMGICMTGVFPQIETRVKLINACHRPTY